MRRMRANWTDEKRQIEREKNAAHMRAWNATEHGKRMKRDQALRKAYGITLEQFEAMIAAQGGVCPICREKISAMVKGRNGAAVDHDHDTGQVRGIPCQPCNAALGTFGDNIETLERAIKYLTGG